MNEDMDNIRCKKCGNSTVLVDKDFFFNGENKAYYCCTDSLCGAYTLVVS